MYKTTSISLLGRKCVKEQQTGELAFFGQYGTAYVDGKKLTAICWSISVGRRYGQEINRQEECKFSVDVDDSKAVEKLLNDLKVPVTGPKQARIASGQHRTGMSI